MCERDRERDAREREVRLTNVCEREREMRERERETNGG